MYLVPLKSAITEALQATFGPGYPERDFQQLHVSIEYPNAPENYRGIWVNYEDTGPLERAGINHKEIVMVDSQPYEVTRWRFQGSLSFTVAALSSLERDRIYDEMVRVLAFANVDLTQISLFRQIIESNDFLGINVQYDTLNATGGDVAAPGTPWGTEEIIYEKTLATDVIGEFVSSPNSNALVNLSAVLVEGYRDDTRTPNFPDQPDNGGGVPFDPHEWH